MTAQFGGEVNATDFAHGLEYGIDGAGIQRPRLDLIPAVENLVRIDFPDVFIKTLSSYW